MIDSYRPFNNSFGFHDPRMLPGSMLVMATGSRYTVIALTTSNVTFFVVGQLQSDVPHVTTFARTYFEDTSIFKLVVDVLVPT